MSEEEFLEILTDVFHEFDVVEKTYDKYNVTYSSFYIKRYIPKLKSKFAIGIVKQVLVGTTTFEGVWEVSLSFTNETFFFKVEKGFEKQSLDIVKEWYFEYEALSVKNNELLNKYNRIRNNFKEELRDYQLNKLL